MTFSVVKKLCAVALVLIMLVGCGAEYKGLDKPLPNAEPDKPTVSDGGLAARQGEWIYYVNGDNFTRHEGERFTEYFGALCRMKVDGSEKSVIINKDVSLFSVDGERIYLCIYEKGRSVISSLKVDGTDYKVLETVDDIYYGGICEFLGDYVYYTKDYKLYRMDKSGKNKIKITDFKVYNLRVGEDTAFFTRDENGDIGNVYMLKNGEASFSELTNSPAYVVDVTADYAYCYMMGNGNVYRYSLDDLKAETVIYGGYTDYLFCEEQNKYFISYSLESDGERDGIFILDEGGGEKTRISEHSGRCFAYYGGYVYYVNSNVLNQLYRCKADGSVDECVSEEFVYDYKPLDVVDNYLYFFSDSDYDRIYRVCLDNNAVECIEYEDISIVG